tara:strand:+ start:4252 stop:4551 length:300 start_codon:yes stop_codon:yes gene_type:complete
MFIYKAYLVRVVNGAIIKATIDLGFGVMLSNMTVHLSGIKSFEGSESEKGKEYLKTLLPTSFSIKTKLDKNLILGEIQSQGESINDKMLNSGLVDKFGE